MNETNFDWDDLRLFLAVATHGGLAKAAEVSGKSAPTLGRRMLALERRLGQELFERLPHGYVLTDNGRALLDTAQQIESGIKPLVPGTDAAVTRRVKISAGTWTTHFLTQNAARLPHDKNVTLQFIAADHLLDIPHREAVIGIRNQRPTQVSLAGRQLNKVHFAVYAISHDIKTWAHVLGKTPSAVWVYSNMDGARCIEVSNPRNALDLALAGSVKTILPTFIGDAANGLIKITENIAELEHTQWLVTHQEDRHLPEVRQVIESIHAVLSDNSNLSI